MPFSTKSSVRDAQKPPLDSGKMLSYKAPQMNKTTIYCDSNRFSHDNTLSTDQNNSHMLRETDG